MPQGLRFRGWICLTTLLVGALPCLAQAVDSGSNVARGQSAELPQAWSIDGESPYVQVFGAGHRVGDGLGYTGNYTDFQWMIPIKVDGELDVLFSDLHFLLRNDGNLGGNINLAYRNYNTDWNRIFGIYAFYDYTETDFNGFRQLGLGAESLGPIFDIRGNLYLPNIYEVRGPLVNQFVGNNLLINRAEVAMTGGDIEVGVNLPEFQNLRSRIYAGGYFYDGHGQGNTSGWKFRGEAELNRTAWVDVAVQDDKLFGRTVSLGATVRYAHRFLPPFRQAPLTMDHKFFRTLGVNYTRDISDRLSDPIARTQFIVLTRDPGVIATDTMGNALNFLHAANGFAGTGTIENPYGTLTAALADANAATSTIYTPFGGTFNENVTLIPNSTVLSNGPVQSVTTQLGTQRLPFSGSNVDLTALPNIIGNVTLANNSRFSGFEVTGAMTATGVTGFTVESSEVNSAAGDAVTLTNVASGLFNRLTVSAAAGRGMLINDSAPTLNNITVTAATDDGIEINSTATNRTIAITDLTVNAAVGQGLDLNVTGAGDLSVALNAALTGTNRISATGNALDGELGAGSTGDLILALTQTTFASNAGAGINLNGAAVGTGDLYVTTLASNTISTAATGGFLADTVRFDANPTQAGVQQVSANSLTIGDLANTTAVTGDGLRLLDPTGTLSIAALNIANDSGTGLLVDTKGGGTIFTLTTTGGSINTTTGPALNLDPLTLNMVLGSVQSQNSPTNGVLLDTVTGTLTISQTTIIDAVGVPIVIQNTPAPLTARFGTTRIDSTISDLQVDNVDVTTGNGMNLTIGFTSLLITGP